MKQLLIALALISALSAQTFRPFELLTKEQLTLLPDSLQRIARRRDKGGEASYRLALWYVHYIIANPEATEHYPLYALKRMVSNGIKEDNHKALALAHFLPPHTGVAFYPGRHLLENRYSSRSRWSIFSRVPYKAQLKRNVVVRDSAGKVAYWHTKRPRLMAESDSATVVALLHDELLVLQELLPYSIITLGNYLSNEARPSIFLQYNSTLKQYRKAGGYEPFSPLLFRDRTELVYRIGIGLQGAERLAYFRAVLENLPESAGDSCDTPYEVALLQAVAPFAPLKLQRTVLTEIGTLLDRPFHDGCKDPAVRDAYVAQRVEHGDSLELTYLFQREYETRHPGELRDKVLEHFFYRHDIASASDRRIDSYYRPKQYFNKLYTYLSEAAEEQDVRALLWRSGTATNGKAALHFAKLAVDSGSDFKRRTGGHYFPQKRELWHNLAHRYELHRNDSAIIWYHKAAKKGHQPAARRLVKLFGATSTEGIEWVKKLGGMEYHIPHAQYYQRALNQIDSTLSWPADTLPASVAASLHAVEKAALRSFRYCADSGLATYQLPMVKREHYRDWVEEQQSSTSYRKQSGRWFSQLEASLLLDSLKRSHAMRPHQHDQPNPERAWALDAIEYFIAYYSPPYIYEYAAWEKKKPVPFHSPKKIFWQQQKEYLLALKPAPTLHNYHSCRSGDLMQMMEQMKREEFEGKMRERYRQLVKEKE